MTKDSCAITALELKALSVPKALLFCLGIEYDMFLCASEKNIKLHFPVFGTNYNRVLASCASRFGLDCTHESNGSVVTGTPVIPVLRYVDFIPGRLHVDEILALFEVKPADPAPKKAADGSFTASFIPYAEYESDESLSDIHGQGYYLTLDYGLSLATHGHLVRFLVRPGCTASKATLRFQRFSGWHKFDLRFDDNGRTSGVVVMPTVQDAIDLFEKYEDEDSDDDTDVLPFSLRPVASNLQVPYMEDAQLRRSRSTHWDLIVELWTRFPRNRNTIVVSNLYDRCKFDDILQLFETAKIVESSMVVDESPSKRHRVFITFSDAEATCGAMQLDGKNTHGKALRVSVAPPYIDAARRGKAVNSRSNTPSPQPTPGPVSPELKPANPADKKGAKGEKGGKNDKKAKSEEKDTKKDNGKKDAKKDGNGKTRDGSKGKSTSPAPEETEPKEVKERSTTGAPAPVAEFENDSLTSRHLDPAKLSKQVGMNVAAKEFVPSFGAPAGPPPPPYQGGNGGGSGASKPPPAYDPVSSPPTYANSPPMYPGKTPPFPANAPPSPALPGGNGSFGMPPPMYMPPPQYSQTPPLQPQPSPTGPPPGYSTNP